MQKGKRNQDFRVIVQIFESAKNEVCGFLRLTGKSYPSVTKLSTQILH